MRHPRPGFLGRSWGKALAPPGREAAPPVDLGVGGGCCALTFGRRLFVSGVDAGLARFPEGQVVPGDRWFPGEDRVVN